METISHPFVHIKTNKTVAVQKTSAKSRKEFWEMLEFNRFGVVAWTLAIVACYSGIVAGLFVDGTNQLEITMVATPTMATLLTILVVAPVRWVIGVGSAAILINILLMIF
jgi:hypothetical protein